VSLAQVGPGQHLVGQFGRGESVGPQHERPGRLAGSGSHYLVHTGHAELAGCLVPVLARLSHAGVEPLPERGGVRIKEDVQDLLARVGQATEDLGPVGVRRRGQSSIAW
jgi:hypothetical protein